MRMRTMSKPESVGPACADRHFQTLDSIQNQQLQAAIEHVVVQHCLEGCARLEVMSQVVRLVAQPIAAKPVVVELGYIKSGESAITEGHATRRKLLDLLLDGERRLVVLHEIGRAGTG